MTRKEFDRLPKVPGGFWLQPMQKMAEELKEFYVNNAAALDELSDEEAEARATKQHEMLTAKAAEELQKLPEWNDPRFVHYTYWACLEQCEKMDAISYSIVENEWERSMRAEATLRKFVLMGYMYACLDRAKELGEEIK